MQLFTANIIINLHENACGGIKLAHNFSNNRLTLKFPKEFYKFFQSSVFIMTSMLFPMNCFEKDCIILKRNFAGILSEKSLSIQQCCKLNIGYLPEDFQIEYNSAILSKLIFLCLYLSLKNYQSTLRRSANFHFILWLSKIIIIMLVI